MHTYDVTIESKIRLCKNHDVTIESKIRLCKNHFYANKWFNVSDFRI